MARLDRRGFALPLTIFLIAILTLMLTAAFAKVQGDRRLGESSGASVAALAIAKSAAQNYMGTRTIRPPDNDSVRINVTGGYGDVVARVVRRPADTLANWMFIIRATGHVIDPAQGADPQAVRTIGQFAQWQTGRMDIPAAWLAANNVRKTPQSGAVVQIIGVDRCGQAPSVAGIRVPSSGGGNDVPSGNGNFGTTAYWSTSGNPPVVEGGTGLSLSQSSATNIDYNAIIGGGFTPDFTSIQMASGAYASQYIDGNATMGTGYGTGLLMVTGDLTFSGVWTQWYGVILVGGQVIFNTSDYSNVYGAMFTGLGEAFGYNITDTDIGDKDIRIEYDSCAINTALANLTGFAPITNGWVDNWAQY